PQDVRITASASGVTRTATLRVIRSDAPALSDLSADPAQVTGGASLRGKVTIDTPAPAGGASVALQSDNAALVVPAGVTVPIGQTSATFTATTTAVTDSVTAKMTATLEGATKTATVTINPALTFTLAADSVPSGSNTTGRVTLSDIA